ncbi:hypothetical protein J7T55_000264 [Diaporthe amygdali]|uniref:uncharacterized protein n=1 Tax=Phomopsis amygdali TaxID=1214568 RepID=UPI0022FED69F|nr:uncharacterized protein J7T55_000264 [Diaporthe amygdali]KAJ0109339.1 hypothetical protein J7T55_000264 [Diaporthe amygdali]
MKASNRPSHHTAAAAFLPSWYYRVAALRFECDCQFEDGDDMDSYEHESERSYDGSDADYYHDLKEEREERKREKLQERVEKEREQGFERTKEEQVCAAYKSLRKIRKEHKTIPVGPFAGHGFKLFCSDHVNHFHSDLYAIKRVDIYLVDDMYDVLNDFYWDRQKPSGGTGVLYGDVYLNAEANCNLGPFRPPKRASRKSVKVKSHDGKYELSFKLIGNGYLKLRVSREMVFMGLYGRTPSTAPPPTAPELFKFVGIWRDPEEKAERQERMAKMRHSSPREPWFETSHPMEAWNSGW